MPRVLSTQLLALSTQTVVCSCPLHPRPCLTPVYTFAWSQSCHVFFPLQLLALFSQTVLCSNLSRPADGICAPPCRLCLVPLFSRRDDSGPSPVGRVMERECQTMGTRDEQLACYWLAARLVWQEPGPQTLPFHWSFCSRLNAVADFRFQATRRCSIVRR